MGFHGSRRGGGGFSWPPQDWVDWVFLVVMTPLLGLLLYLIGFTIVGATHAAWTGNPNWP